MQVHAVDAAVDDWADVPTGGGTTLAILNLSRRLSRSSKGSGSQNAGSSGGHTPPGCHTPDGLVQTGFAYSGGLECASGGLRDDSQFQRLVSLVRLWWEAHKCIRSRRLNIPQRVLGCPAHAVLAPFQAKAHAAGQAEMSDAEVKLPTPFPHVAVPAPPTLPAAGSGERGAAPVRASHLSARPRLKAQCAD